MYHIYNIVLKYTCFTFLCSKLTLSGIDYNARSLFLFIIIRGNLYEKLFGRSNHNFLLICCNKLFFIIKKNKEECPLYSYIILINKPSASNIITAIGPIILFTSKYFLFLFKLKMRIIPHLHYLLLNLRIFLRLLFPLILFDDLYLKLTMQHQIHKLLMLNL